MCLQLQSLEIPYRSLFQNLKDSIIMIHFQIIGLTTVGTGIFGLIGDLDTQPLTIGIMTGIALITGILGDRWLNRKQDNQK